MIFHSHCVRHFPLLTIFVSDDLLSTLHHCVFHFLRIIIFKLLKFTIDSYVQFFFLSLAYKHFAATSSYAASAACVCFAEFPMHIKRCFSSSVHSVLFLFLCGTHAGPLRVHSTYEPKNIYK